MMKRRTKRGLRTSRWALAATALVVGVVLLGLSGPVGAQGGSIAVWFLGFNTTQPPFNNVLARQAVAAAINRARIAEASRRTLATGLEPPGCLAYNPSGARLPAYNPEQAARLLAQAGISADDTQNLGLWALSLVTRDNSLRAGLDILVSDLAALGFRVQIREFGNFNALEAIATQPVVKMSYWGIGWNEAGCVRGTFLEDLLHSKGDFNYFGYRNADVDSLIDRAQASNDRNTKADLFRQAELRANEDVVVLPIFWRR